MTEQTEIVRIERVNLGSIQVSPEDMINRGATIATALAKVIKDKKLFSRIGNKDYVRVEGWNTLGAILGVLPREEKVSEIENGYEAYVNLLRTSDGVIIGGASAICTRDEKNWKTRDDYAVRSMAITRATGKAFRLGFSWIMELAGYQPTPAEEMVEGTIKEDSENGNGNDTKRSYSGEFIEKVEKWWVEADVLPEGDDRRHLINLLNKSPFSDNALKKDLVTWGKAYRSFRDQDATAADAAELATKEWQKP